ncbi:MAG: signal peptidase [Acidimicrobiaceae bacterium]|jgi:signal peptidase I
MLKRTITLLAIAIVMIAAVVGRPTAWGGTTAYVTTRGTSMAPSIHTGDLAVVRKAAHYDVGDVVAYHSNVLDTAVLHRIVDVADGRFATKGDNNSFIDPDHPSATEITGKLWTRVPKGGQALAAAGASALPGGAGALLFFGRNRRRPRPKALPSPARAHTWRTITLSFCGLAVASSVLGVLAFTRPTVATTTEQLHYVHSGAFTYAMPVLSDAVYQASELKTGDPVFLSIVNTLDVTFDYHIDGVTPDSAGGDIAMTATVTGNSGWHRTLELAARRQFSSDRTSVVGTLDLVALRALITQVEFSTGFRGSYAVTVAPQVDARARLSDQPVADTFAPQLAFDLDTIQLRIASASGSAERAATLQPKQERTVDHGSTSQAELGAGQFHALVGVLRLLAVLLGLGSVGAAAVCWRVGKHRFGSTEAGITLRHGHRVVEISTMPHMERSVTNVTGMSDLVRVAEAHQSSILRESNADRHIYWCEADGRLYRYAVQ